MCANPCTLRNPGYADQYGPYFSFTENIEDGDQFYLDNRGHLHDAKQAPNALAQTIGSVDRVDPPFAVSFYQLLSGDAPVVCAFQPQGQACNLACSVTVTDGDGTQTLKNMYTCYGCDARRHRCVNFDFNPPTEPDSSDLRCKPVRLGVQAA